MTGNPTARPRPMDGMDDGSRVRNRQDGVVSLEFTLLLPVVALVLLAVLQLLGLARDALAVQDLARQAARLAAVEPADDVHALVGDRMPDASLTLTEDGALVTAVVARDCGVLGRDVTVRSAATAMVEPVRVP